MPLSTKILIAICLALSLLACSRTMFLRGDGSEDVIPDPVPDDQDLAVDEGLDPDLQEPDLQELEPEPPAEIEDPDLDVAWDEEEFEIPVVPETYWIRIYNAEGMNEPTQIRPTREGGYVFAASGFSPEYRTLTTIVKLDVYGQVQWARRLDLVGPEVQGIVQTADRGFVILLLSVPAGDGSGSGLVKLDENGHVVWARVIGASFSGALSTLEKTRAGGFLLGGSFDQDRQVNFWIVLVDRHGGIVWQKALIGPVGNFTLQAVAQAEDGGFVAAGYAMPQWPPYYQHCDMWLAKLDPGGNLAWQERMTGSDMEAAYSIIPASSNGFLVSGLSSYDFYSVTSFGPLVMRLDERGGILWQKIIKDNSLGEINGLALAQGGGYMMAGVSSEGILGSNGALTKMYEDGTVAWLRGYSESETEYLGHVEQTYDGGYVAAGATRLDRDVDASPWVVKSDDAGMGWIDCPDILGYEMTLLVEDADFGTMPAMANVQDTFAEIIDFELSTEEIEVEVETICEGE